MAGAAEGAVDYRMNPPPNELLATAWFPFISSFAFRVNVLLNHLAGQGVFVDLTSWFRTANENQQVGGSPESQHLFALGADFAGSSQAQNALLTHAPAVSLIAVNEPGHVHLQLFPAGALSRAGVRFPGTTRVVA